MITIAAIRTHQWGEDEQRLFAQLSPVFGDRLVVVFHNRPEGLSLPLPVVDISDRWLKRNGLRKLHDWGWRCGDYFLYALRQAMPDADSYWLIEPDVWFAGDVAGFFAATGAMDHDLLGVKVQPMDPAHRFGRGLPGLPLFKTIFALTRWSGRSLDGLFALRQAYSAGDVGGRVFSNDETFCVSHLLADGGLTHASLSEVMPDWFPPECFRTDPDVLIDTLQDRGLQGVFHPVRGHASFVRATGARLASNIGFLGAMGGSLARLAPDELAAIAAEAARRMETALKDTAAAARGNG